MAKRCTRSRATRTRSGLWRSGPGQRRHAFGGVGWPSEVEERSTPVLDGRDRLPRHDIRIRRLGNEKRKYLKWVLTQSLAPKTKIEGVITDDAVAMLSEKLSTPLQFEYYLTRALEEAYKVGQKPVSADMIENVLAKDINALEPRLTRQGYNAKVLAELLNAKPREIKSFLSGQLAPGRTQELQSELLAAGIPL